MIVQKVPPLVFALFLGLTTYANPTVHLDKKLPQVEESPEVEDEMIYLEEPVYGEDDIELMEDMEAEPEENILDVVEVSAESDDAGSISLDDAINSEQQFLLKQSDNKKMVSDEPSIFIPWIIFGVSMIFLIFSNARPQFGKRE